MRFIILISLITYWSDVWSQINENQNASKHLLFSNYFTKDSNNVYLIKFGKSFSTLEADSIINQFRTNGSSMLFIQNAFVDNCIKRLEMDQIKKIAIWLAEPEFYLRTYQIGNTIYQDGFLDCFEFQYCLVKADKTGIVRACLLLSPQCRNFLYSDFIRQTKDLIWQNSKGWKYIEPVLKFK